MPNGLGRHQRAINITMLVATLYVVSRTALLHVDEMFPYGAEIGEVLYDASLAYAAAWFFQWLVIVRPANARQAEIGKVVAPRVYDVVRPARQLNLTMRAAAGLPGDVFPPASETELKRMCQLSLVHAPPPGVMAPNWWVYLEFLIEKSAAAHDALRPYYDRLTDELVALIEAEARSHPSFDLMLRLRPNNANLDAFYPDIKGWFDAADALRHHHDTVLAPGTYHVEEGPAVPADPSD